MIFRGSGPVLLRNPIFCNFPGGGESGPPVPPLDPRMLSSFTIILMGKKELVTLLLLSSWCFVNAHVLRLFLARLANKNNDNCHASGIYR